LDLATRSLMPEIVPRTKIEQLRFALVEVFVIADLGRAGPTRLAVHRLSSAVLSSGLKRRLRNLATLFRERHSQSFQTVCDCDTVE
jgi:hypothetical protein